MFFENIKRTYNHWRALVCDFFAESENRFMREILLARNVPY